jgi:hypothetical protein
MNLNPAVEKALVGRAAPSAPIDVKQIERSARWGAARPTFKNNRLVALAIPFGAEGITTDALRLWITSTPGNVARVLEVLVWPASEGDLPPLTTPIE